MRASVSGPAFLGALFPDGIGCLTQPTDCFILSQVFLRAQQRCSGHCCSGNQRFLCSEQGGKESISGITDSFVPAELEEQRGLAREVVLQNGLLSCDGESGVGVEGHRPMEDGFLSWMSHSPRAGTVIRPTRQPRRAQTSKECSTDLLKGRFLCPFVFFNHCKECN